jgi:hypothetical protein
VIRLPFTPTTDTFRWSLPSPFQPMNRFAAAGAGGVWATSAGGCGLVSGEVYLLPKVRPSSAEYIRFRLSLPSPFHAR